MTHVAMARLAAQRVDSQRVGTSPNDSMSVEAMRASTYLQMR